MPDERWEIVEPLIPPQGGGTRHVDKRAAFTAIVCAGRVRGPHGDRTPPGSWLGTRPGCGADCTGRCWIDSVSKRRSTGPRTVVDATGCAGEKDDMPPLDPGRFN